MYHCIDEFIFILLNVLLLDLLLVEVLFLTLANTKNGSIVGTTSRNPSLLLKLLPMHQAVGQSQLIELER